MIQTSWIFESSSKMIPNFFRSPKRKRHLKGYLLLVTFRPHQQLLEVLWGHFRKMIWVRYLNPNLISVNYNQIQKNNLSISFHFMPRVKHSLAYRVCTRTDYLNSKVLNAECTLFINVKI